MKPFNNHSPLPWNLYDECMSSLVDICNELTDALEKLYDAQNGTPLIRDKALLEEAILLSKKAIDRSKGKQS